jgi:hypothetical protein
LIIAQRGAPLKAQVRPVAPKKYRQPFVACIFLFSSKKAILLPFNQKARRLTFYRKVRAFYLFKI